MIIIGFICGVVVMLPWLFVRRRAKPRVQPLTKTTHRVTKIKEESWEQTRNFLYYDGTEMPIKKEEQYE